MKPPGGRSSKKLLWFDLQIGHQDGGISNGHQGDMPYWNSLIAGHNATVTSAQWSQDSKWMVTSCEDKTACLWSLGLSDPVMTFTYVKDNFGADKEGGLKPTKVMEMDCIRSVKSDLNSLRQSDAYMCR